MASGIVLLPALAWVPTWGSPAPDVVSVAVARGYSPSLAFVVAALWVALAASIGFFLAKAGDQPALPPPAYEHDPAHIAAALVALVALAYFPWFLAKMGPYIEDNVLLTATHRMQAGMAPYRDFEFLYGPLMLYPAHWFMAVFGYSMASMYAYVALGEMLLFAAVLLGLQAMIPARRLRWLVFVLMAIALTTALVGPNQSGLRRLPALVALVVLAAGPYSPRVAGSAAALTGVQLAYSHDVGLAALGAAGLLYGLLTLGERWRGALAYGLAFAAIAIATWLGISAILLRDLLPHYLAEVRSLTTRYAAGEAAFRFYWTLNSMALFALLGVSAAAAMNAVRRGRLGGGGEETRLLVLGVGFALIGLRSALNRADAWHMISPFLVLLFVWWLPGAANGFGLGRRARGWARGLGVVAVATYAIGILPSASWVARGWTTGARATITRDFVLMAPPATAAPALEFEGIRPDSAQIALARYFATDERIDVPVLFYSTTWAVGKQIGVVKRDYLNDDFMYSDERGLTARRFLDENPEAYVIMRAVAWDRLNGRGDPDAVERPIPGTLTKEIAQRLSSPHFDQMEEEARLREGRWDRLVGGAIVDRHEVAASFGEFVVLAPRRTGGG